jgi:hypothetical protein
MLNDSYIFPKATITPYSGGAYVANQLVGGVFNFDLRAQGVKTEGGLILGVSVFDNDLEGAAGDLFLFGGAITAHADRVDFNANISFADMQKRLGRITLGTFESYTNLKMYNTDYQATSFKPIPIRYYDNNGIISGAFRCSGTPTYAASKSLIFMLHILTQ